MFASPCEAQRRTAFRFVLFSLLLLTSASAQAAGHSLSLGGDTDDKPQSKVWFHDGKMWAVFRGASGVAIHERVGDSWMVGSFIDAVLSQAGNPDVKWDGTNLFILNHSLSPKLFKYQYDPTYEVWMLQSGFPITVPNPAGSETLVIDVDSNNRLWLAGESNGEIQVYYTEDSNHRNWSSEPVILQTGVNADDICSITAFGGNRVGVFWSDQNRDEFGFRFRYDNRNPRDWEALEVAHSGSGVADDHVNLATESNGRIYALSKDDQDLQRLHRREIDGTWTTVSDITAGDIGTRGIVMLSEAEHRVYALYTRWGVSPHTIEYRFADLTTLAFGSPTTFLSSPTNMNNVTGTKQDLPAGVFLALGESSGHVWWNGWGAPAPGMQPPEPPSQLSANADVEGRTVSLNWEPSPDYPAYLVERQVDTGLFEELNPGGTTAAEYVDFAPPAGELSYRVRSLGAYGNSSPSHTVRVTYYPMLPPGSPENLSARTVPVGAADGNLVLWFDAGQGQAAADLSGHRNHGRLGASENMDASDPTWSPGMVGGALQFDGLDDYVYVADSPSLSMSGSFTIEAWVKPQLGSRSTIINKGKSGKRNYRLVITTTGKIEFRWENQSGNDQELETTSLLSSGQWYHVAAVYDAGLQQNRVYLDGVQVGTLSTNGIPATNDTQCHIGAAFSSSLKDHFQGVIDQLRLIEGAQYTSDFTPVGDPSELAGPQDVSVLVQWEEPTTGGAAVSYDVWRSINGSAANRLNSEPIYNSAFIDAQPVEGDLCYTVVGFNSSAEEGSFSVPACTEVQGMPTAVPQNLTVIPSTNDPQSLQLQWTHPASSGVSFNVFRSIDGAAMQRLNTAPLADFSYLDESVPFGELCYAVTAVDADQVESAASESACQTHAPPAPDPPAAPTELQAFPVTLEGPEVPRGNLVLDFDAGSGDVLHDASVHAATGYLGDSEANEPQDPTWDTGHVDSALRFDGVDDYATVPDSDALDFAGSFTIEAWVQRASSGQRHCIVSKGISNARNFWLLLTKSGYVEFVWESADGANHDLQTSTAIADFDWHHIAAIYDAENAENRIYIDGVLAKRGAESGTPVTNDEVVHVGARHSLGQLGYFFDGKIDLLRISAGAVYSDDFTPPVSFETVGDVEATQIQWQPVSGELAGYHVYRSSMGQPPQLLTPEPIGDTSYVDPQSSSTPACYHVKALDSHGQESPASASVCVGPEPPAPPSGLTVVLQEVENASEGNGIFDCNEGIGQLLDDISPFGNHGLLGGTSDPESADPTWTDGVEGGALAFDGIDDVLLVPDEASLDFSGSFTLEAWVRRLSSGKRQSILSKGRINDRNYWLQYTKSGYIEFRWETAGGSNHGTITNFKVTDDLWHHIAGIYDFELGKSRIYFDGQLVKEISDHGTPLTNDAPLIIGGRERNGYFDYFLDGSLDLVRVSSGVVYREDFTPPLQFVSDGTREVANLNWEASTATDVAGYHVYAGEEGDRIRVNSSLVTGTQFTHDTPSGNACYVVTAVSQEGLESSESDVACAGDASVKPEADPAASPWAHLNLRAGPNPFNPVTTIRFALARTEHVRIDIFDVRGRKVRRLAADVLGPGLHAITWNGRNDRGSIVASGAYFAAFEAGAKSERLRLILLK